MRVFVLLFGLGFSLVGFAWSEADEQRWYSLNQELRCLVCQNQSIADSDAELAQDLRAQVRQMIEAGKSDTQIRHYMTERYGDFVLYRPPFKPQTWLLWTGPFLMLAVGLLLAWRIGRGRRVSAATETQPVALDRILKEVERD